MWNLFTHANIKRISIITLSCLSILVGALLFAIPAGQEVDNVLFDNFTSSSAHADEGNINITVDGNHYHVPKVFVQDKDYANGGTFDGFSEILYIKRNIDGQLITLPSNERSQNGLVEFERRMKIRIFISKDGRSHDEYMKFVEKIEDEDFIKRISQIKNNNLSYVEINSSTDMTMYNIALFKGTKIMRLNCTKTKNGKPPYPTCYTRSIIDNTNMMQVYFAVENLDIWQEIQDFSESIVKKQIVLNKLK